MVEVISVADFSNSKAGPSRLSHEYIRRPKRASKKRSLGWGFLAAASTITATHAQSTVPGARWGQASALYGDSALIHGGKTNGDSPGGGGYTFTSGPATGELLLLNLTESFSTAYPPWTSINTSSSSISSPSVAFHSISPIRKGSQLMLFGGDVLDTSTSPSGNDSAYMLKLSASSSEASWSAADSSWGEPIRRIHHSAETDGKGSIWIMGGEKDDGSMIQLDELWAFNQSATSPSFVQQSSPTGGLVGATTTLLSDGTVLVLGGQNSTGLQDLSSVSAYSITDKTWERIATSGVNSTSQGYPAPRQGHVAVSLPDKRVFIHGGASSDWSEAMSDAWILDWKASPPVWSQMSTPSSSVVPSARFAHSAVAIGNRIVIMFGWANYNPADSQLYVFDASTLVSDSAGVLTGGTWTSTYTPDSSAVSSLTNSKGGSSGSGNTGGSSSSSSSGSSTDGNGQSSSQGSDSSSGVSSQTPSSSSSSSTTNEPAVSSSVINAQPDDPASNDTSSAGGKKAGAALGALLGLGLVAGAGYFVYRKKNPPPDDYRFGDGAAGLLQSSNHYSGADDDPYALEKGIEYTGVGMGGIASFRPGTKPAGPRMSMRDDTMISSSPWSMANIGHAMEGSGPHLRERLALITGIGLSNSNTQQQRFDMLADEDDDHVKNEAILLRNRHNTASKTEDYDEEEEDQYLGMASRVRERSYGRLEQMDDEEMDRSYGDLAGVSARHQRNEDHAHDGGFVTSPFEEEEGDEELGRGALFAGAIYSSRKKEDDRDDYDDDDDNDDEDDSTHGTGDNPSSNSHPNTTSSKSGQQSHSSGGGNGALVSFSDSQRPNRRKTGDNELSPLVRRSPTWWDRFMGQSFLERSASGRLHPGPRAEEPIRDPAEPPLLVSIRESSRSTHQSGRHDPFTDTMQASDEMGRFLSPYEERHARSLSSLQSGRTATSSVMEARLQRMDVVQRVGTGSSRRTYSSGRGSQGSSGSNGLSRNVSTRSTAGGHHFVTSPTESTPGSVVFDPSSWNTGLVPGTVQEQDEGEDRASTNACDESFDVVDLGYTPVLHIGGRKRSNTAETNSAPANPTTSHDATIKRAKMSSARSLLVGSSRARNREGSEAPSVTPSTTKRARQNRQLTAPVSPQPQRSISPPTQGSVLDRVKAIERKRTQEGSAALLPIPRSPAPLDFASTSPEADVFVPGRGGRPIPTKLNTSFLNQEQQGSELVSSPLPVSSTSNKQEKVLRYTHGLVPKPQLFVANPDGRQASADS
ncbi:hypothetical protein CBS101457_000758 [Exobasidium rhododendri]|nr:hypothetical protein CBS101457_000758 [Exobasidium rhododendri]